ncbi:MFS transporter [bacterium]|nr:MFS transporter [bacterium]
MSKNRKAGLLLVFVTVFIDLLGFGIVMPLLPRYGRHFQASGFQLGLLMASFSAMQFIFAPIWGRISDRIGRRPVLLVGLVGSTASYALFGYATSKGYEGTILGLSALTWLFITRIGAGIAGATISTAQAYIADVTGPEERAKGMALIGAAFGIGFTFGPLIGAGFVSADPVVNLSNDQFAVLQSIEETPSSESIDAAVVEIREVAPLTEPDEALLRLVLSDPEQDVNPTPSAAPGYVASLLSALALLFAIFKLPESLKPDSKAAAAHKWINPGQLTKLLATKNISVILIGIFISTFAFAQFESALSLLTRRMGMAPRYNFYVFAYIGFVLTLSQGGLVRRLVPKLGEFKMAVTGAVLMTIGLALIGIFGESQSAGTLYAVLPLSVIGFSFITPSLQSLLSRLAADDQQGEILGVGQSLSSLARILGPVVGLTLEARYPSGPYWTGAGVMLLGGILFLTLKKAVPKPVAED